MNYIIDMVGSNYDELIKSTYQLPNNHHRHMNHNHQQYHHQLQHSQQLAQHHRQAQPNNHQHQTQQQMFQRLQQLQNEYQQSSRANQYAQLEQRLAQPVINQMTRTADSTNYNQNRAHIPNPSPYNTNAINNENDDLLTDIDDSQLFFQSMPYETLWQQINNIQNIENRLENQPIRSSNFNSTIPKF